MGAVTGDSYSNVLSSGRRIGDAYIEGDLSIGYDSLESSGEPTWRDGQALSVPERLELAKIMIARWQSLRDKLPLRMISDPDDWSREYNRRVGSDGKGLAKE